MLHNSLLIRDFLQDRNANSICRQRRHPHARVERLACPEESLDGKTIILAGEWRVAGETSVPHVRQVVADARDFLRLAGVNVVSCAVMAGVVMSSK